MTCTNCGQELKEGAKFCTKCGTRFKETMNLVPANSVLPIVSIILSAIGIIGYFILKFFRFNPRIFYVSQSVFFILPLIGIIVALIVLNKQKSLISFIAGLISCAFLIIIQAYYIFMNLKYF